MATDLIGCPFCGEPLRSDTRRCESCGVLLGPPTRASIFDDQMDVTEVFKGHLDDFAIAYLSGAELRDALELDRFVLRQYDLQPPEYIRELVDIPGPGGHP